MGRVFFDVGAHDGSALAYKCADPDCHVYAFEPTPSWAKRIRETYKGGNYHSFEVAVSDVEGFVPLRIVQQNDEECNSLLDLSASAGPHEWTGRRFTVSEIITVPCIRLDNFILDHGIENIEYLHIDAQGSDLKVLQGMGWYLRIVKAGVMEAAVKPDILYVGQNTLEESRAFLEANGFEVTNVELNDAQGNECNIFFRRQA